MNIRIEHQLEGARRARGVAVIIDVFRAFTTECFFAHNHAEKIIPVASKELAYEWKKQNPDYLLAGERRGVMLPGFDYGNSPAQIEHIDFTGRTVIHTTSAGTQGLENAQQADVVLAGSLVNAKAVVAYIRRNQWEEVSLVCMGLDARQQTEEDNLCAEYLKSLLEGKEPDITKAIEGLKKTSGQKFFDPARSNVFPTRDFELCTAVNRFDFVLRWERDAQGRGFMRKIDMSGS